MPRRRRQASGGLAYHVLNRGVGRSTVFKSDGDYEAFETTLAEALQRIDARLLSYCLMPNHWHLVLWPRRDGDLSEFMRWLTVTHTQRWHAHHRTAGTGPLYQGRFRSFAIQQDDHLLTVCRYVERNPLRAKLVNRAEDWPWSSLWLWAHDRAAGRELLSDWPIPGGRPRDWLRRVQRPETGPELESLSRCIRRGAPFGGERWVAQTARRLGLESTLRPRGRPRKSARKLQK